MSKMAQIQTWFKTSSKLLYFNLSNYLNFTHKLFSISAQLRTFVDRKQCNSPRYTMTPRQFSLFCVIIFLIFGAPFMGAGYYFPIYLLLKDLFHGNWPNENPLANKSGKALFACCFASLIASALVLLRLIDVSRLAIFLASSLCILAPIFLTLMFAFLCRQILVFNAFL